MKLALLLFVWISVVASLLGCQKPKSVATPDLSDAPATEISTDRKEDALELEENVDPSWTRIQELARSYQSIENRRSLFND